MENSNVLEGATTPLVVIALSLVIFLASFRKVKRAGSGVPVHDGQSQVKTVEDIPNMRYFSYWLPSLVEDLASLYQLKQEGVKALETWAKKYGGIFQRKSVYGRVLFLQDPSLIQQILNSGDPHVLNKPKFLYHRVFPEWMRDGLVPSSVKIWTPHRKIVERAFTFSVLPAYTSMINKYSRKLVSSLLSHSSSSSFVDGPIVHQSICSHVIQIFSAVTLASTQTSPVETEQFYSSFQQCKDITVHKLMNFWNQIPPIWWLNPKSREYSRASLIITEYINKAIRRKIVEMERGETEGDGEGRKRVRSVVEEMIGAGFPIKEIRDEVLAVFVAGYDTTTITIHFFMQYLAENPLIQEKCRQEVDEIFNLKTDSSSDELVYLTMNDLTELKYLERCILETLRLQPPVPLFLRQLSAPLKLDGFELEEGTTIGFNAWALHRDPKIYPEPERFDPDRFLPEAVKERHPFAHIPFSKGPRNCVGWKLGIMDMKVMLGWLLRHFEISSKDRIADMKILFEVTIFPEHSFRLELKARKHAQAFRN